MLCAIGCGGGDTPQLAPVSGKVTVGGSEPFSEGLVRFLPANPEAGLNSREATTDIDGTYKIQFQPGSPGLQPGDYKVMFSLYKMPDGSKPPDQTGEADPKHPSALGAFETVPQEFAMGTAPDCKVTVTEQGGTFDFNIPELVAPKK